MGKKETLTTLAFPNEGKGNTSPRGRSWARKTDASLFTVYCRRGITKRRQHDKTHRPLKGKRLTTFCASLALLQPLLSLTHWIFRSLMLPYKSSSHSAKCVRCASLRSGGRRLAVRTAMEHPIGALPRTPFPASRDFPSRGNEKISGTGYCVTYDTESQSRNADFILIARKGDTSTLGTKGPVKLKNPWAEGPSILRTFPFTTLLHNPRAGGPSTLTPAGRVQRCPIISLSYLNKGI